MKLPAKYTMLLLVLHWNDCTQNELNFFKFSSWFWFQTHRMLLLILRMFHTTWPQFMNSSRAARREIFFKKDLNNITAKMIQSFITLVIIVHAYSSWSEWSWRKAWDALWKFHILEIKDNFARHGRKLAAYKNYTQPETNFYQAYTGLITFVDKCHNNKKRQQFNVRGITSWKRKQKCRPWESFSIHLTKNIKIICFVSSN